MNKKSWFIFGVIVIAVLGGMIYLSTKSKLDISDITNEQMTTIIGSEARNGQIADHVRGKSDAKVVLIEYGDFQCGPCKTHEATVHKLHETFKDDLAVIYRNYPVASSHPNARAAAATAEAAGLQGKFWEMHDLIYENQENWSGAQATERDTVFQSYAKQLGLDIEKFKEDLSGDAVKKKIDFDLALGRAQKVTGTPSFFIGNQSINVGDLENSVKEALKSAGVTVEE